MTSRFLSSSQSQLRSEIAEYAQTLGYDPAVIEPVGDGVADVEGYLRAPLKVMWILKEPWDDFDSAGKPTGGGWNFFEDDDARLMESVRHGRSFHKIVYASYALLNGIACYNDMPWIRDKPDMALVTRRLAYVNTGKMPAQKETPPARLKQLYETWKPFLFRQFDLYEPDVMIFAGTLQLYAGDMGLDLSRPLRTYKNGDNVVADVHRWNGRLVIWVNHPNAHEEQAAYVDSILSAVREERG